MRSTSFVLSIEQCQKRPLTQDVLPFLNNIVFQYTYPLSFETEPHSIHTNPLARQHCDSYLQYNRYKTLEILSSQIPFQIIFNSAQGINTVTYYRTIHPQNIILSIQDVFITYTDKLIEHNENQDTPFFLPFHLKSLTEKHDYLETKIPRHNNPHKVITTRQNTN